jgi:hypothetical protein
MNDSRSYSKAHLVILVIQIVIMLSTLGMNLYFYSENLRIASENQQLQLSSRRADISIFVNWYEYRMTTENLTLTVYGEVHNEGTRDTVVKSFRIGIKYALGSDNDVQFGHTWTGSFASWFGWQNLTLMTRGVRAFIVTESYEELKRYPNLVDIKPEEGWITFSHDDGVGIQEQTRTFSLKYFP